MTKLYLLSLFGLIFVALILVLKFQPSLLKKYWKYLLGTAVGAFALFLVAVNLKKKEAPEDTKGDKKKKKLDKKVEEINKEAEKEIEVAREKEQEVKDEVSDIKKIEDKEERLKELAGLFNRTRR